MLVSIIFVGSYYNKIDQQYEESVKAFMVCFTSKKFLESSVNWHLIGQQGVSGFHLNQR
jgi:hypothetical protein